MSKTKQNLDDELTNALQEAEAWLKEAYPATEGSVTLPSNLANSLCWESKRLWFSSSVTGKILLVETSEEVRIAAAYVLNDLRLILDTKWRETIHRYEKAIEEATKFASSAPGV